MRLPERIGRYRVQSVIGVGGFAVVYRAHDEVLDDAVAIKVLAENWGADADIRGRFLEEARLLRRIRNDHLVTVHDIGELDEDGRPYFVMEFAKRGTLGDRLATRGSAGLDPASARQLTTALADGMGSLHRAGIVHRDVNPRNLFLQAHDALSAHDKRGARATQVHRGLISGDERVLLGDLGLAKDVVRTGGAASVIGGTPHYHAPEQLDPHAPVRPAADIFAATGVLWEAVTGTPPPLPPDLEGALVLVDDRWQPLFERGLAADPDERFADMDAWRDAVLARLGPGTAGAKRAAVTQPTALARTGPYKGLAAFQPEDAAQFFGRDALVAELIDRLGRSRTLMVGGPSGSGKSSLVRAGLIPAVATGGLAGSERWPVVLFAPRSEPIRELAYQLVKTTRTTTQRSTAAGDAYESLGDPLGARYVSESITDITGGLLVVIDQFEELFTQGGSREEQEAFLDLLAGMVDPTDSRVRLVMAMRADFYGTSALFPWLAQRITQNQVLVGPMTRSELRQAIEEPARQAGLRLQDGLVDAILEDGGSEPGSLPLVSHALAETWRRRRGTSLTLTAYREAGGVAGALAHTAEAVYQERFDDAQRRVARRLLLRLVTPGDGTPDTRRPLQLGDLNDGETEEMSHVAAELTDARLLTVDRNTIEIAHEALILSWPRLGGWIEESRDDLRVRQRIDRAGAEWVAQGHEPDLLYRGTPLQSALEWGADHGDALSPAGRDLLAVSEAAAIEAEARREQTARRSRRVRRAAVAVLGVLTTVAAAASLVAFSALGEATSRFAQSLATQAAGLVDQNPRLALALAVESIGRVGSPSLEARVALVEGSRALESATFAPAGSAMDVGDALALALRPDGEVVATGNRDGTVRLWEAASGRALGAPLDGHDAAVEALAFSPDGRWLVSASDDETLRRWDLADPAAVPSSQLLGTTGGIVWAAAVSADGTTVASGSLDGTVRLWDLQEAEQLGEPLLEDQGLTIDALTISPDGALLLAGAGPGQGEVWAWSLPERDEAFDPFIAHDSFLSGLAVDPAGETFATAGSDGRIRLWGAATADLIAEPFEGHTGDLRGVQFSPDGRLLLAGDEQGRVRAWSTADQEELPATVSGHDGQVLKTALSGTGDVLATLGFDHTVRIWTRGEDELGTVLDGHEQGAFGLAVSPDGDVVATGDGTGAIRVFSTETGELLAGPMTDHTSAVWALDVSPDGATVASGGADGTVLVHDLGSGDVVARADGHDGAVTVARFHGDLLITGGDDGLVRTWDADGRAAGEPLGPHRGGVTDMAWGPDGILAVSDREGNVKLWRPDDGVRVGSSLPTDGNTVWSVDWSRDGALLALASADENVTLATPSGESTASLTPHPGGATGVAFLADDATAVSASRDGAIRLWDVVHGRPIGGTFAAHDETVWRVVAHPHDTRFVTSSEDGTVRIWDVLDTGRACDRAGGAFDEEQQRTYLGPGETAVGCG